MPPFPQEIEAHQCPLIHKWRQLFPGETVAFGGVGYPLIPLNKNSINYQLSIL